MQGNQIVEHLFVLGLRDDHDVERCWHGQEYVSVSFELGGIGRAVPIQGLAFLNIKPARPVELLAAGIVRLTVMIFYRKRQIGVVPRVRGVVVGVE
ncbi:hypothetical protein D9M70_550370 [compost metagenome]